VLRAYVLAFGLSIFPGASHAVTVIFDFTTPNFESPAVSLIGDPASPIPSDITFTVAAENSTGGPNTANDTISYGASGIGVDGDDLGNNETLTFTLSYDTANYDSILFESISFGNVDVGDSVQLTLAGNSFTPAQGTASYSFSATDFAPDGISFTTSGIQLVAAGTDGNDDLRISQIVLDVTPAEAEIPLPAGLPLLLTGLAGLGLMARRRARA